MLGQIIGSLIILVVVYIFYKAGSGFIEKENLLGKFFPIGSGILATFLIGLIFLG
jgi:hypothetical protein